MSARGAVTMRRMAGGVVPGALDVSTKPATPAGPRAKTRVNVPATVNVATALAPRASRKSVRFAE